MYQLQWLIPQPGFECCAVRLATLGWYQLCFLSEHCPLKKAKLTALMEGIGEGDNRTDGKAGWEHPHIRPGRGPQETHTNTHPKFSEADLIRGRSEAGK